MNTTLVHTSAGWNWTLEPKLSVNTMFLAWRGLLGIIWKKYVMNFPMKYRKSVTSSPSRWNSRLYHSTESDQCHWATAISNTDFYCICIWDCVFSNRFHVNLPPQIRQASPVHRQCRACQWRPQGQDYPGWVEKTDTMIMMTTGYIVKTSYPWIYTPSCIMCIVLVDNVDIQVISFIIYACF